MAIDKIGSKALVDCSVAAADIAPGTITGTQLAGSIANAKLANSTVTINGTSVALGASASINPVSWQSVVVSDGSTVTTMVAGRGYFVNNTSAAGIVKLPISASAGDTVAIKDYAGNFATNKLTIQRNGHNIQGVANDSSIQTNRASLTLVYVDATKGWLYANESNVGDLQLVTFVSATGGTVTTSGNDKIHSFTGDGNFVVSTVSQCSSNNKVGYLVVAGGGGGGGNDGGGGGAGGYREGRCGPVTPYTDSPLGTSGLTVTTQTYPITVGAGGTAGTASSNGGTGGNSIFSTITSAGGAGGKAESGIPNVGLNGGSGSGGGAGGGCAGAGGSGNTPPVSPPQGNNGGNGYNPAGAGQTPPCRHGGGGGGAAAVGSNATSSSGGNGGAGATTVISATPTIYSGGGGGGGRSSGGGGGPGGGGQGSNTSGTATAGSANTGSGGGGAGEGSPGCRAASGGKGIVIIRYKFQ